ncbi:minor capsid protein [Streptococcus ruminantium]|uniref:minor capsid protein n=1 Tax=Streptococcus ruminantium TaxID=1917441 RepID=UPI0012DDDEEB|nr:minor capsid protein [Streptococcus ruminantium]BDD37937.1 minor capsid protein [Streptococcus ruminantium]
MSIPIHVDLKDAKAKLSDRNIRRGHIAMSSQILLDSDRYVPNRDGHLRPSGHMSRDGKEISWNTVYARAQFYGKNGIVTFRKYTTPGTGKRWDEKAKAIHMTDWIQRFVKGAGF